MNACSAVTKLIFSTGNRHAISNRLVFFRYEIFILQTMLLSISVIVAICACIYVSILIP